MSKKLFGTIIEFEGSTYRYNEAEATLEAISYLKIDENFDLVETDEPQVTTSVGLTIEGAEEDLMGYIAAWHMDLEEEYKEMMGEFQ